MKRKDELNKLREDEHYYGKFGKQFLSNSDISLNLINKSFGARKTNETNPRIPGWRLFSYSYS
jgi:hypothetical protein